MTFWIGCKLSNKRKIKKGRQRCQLVKFIQNCEAIELTWQLFVYYFQKIKAKICICSQQDLMLVYKISVIGIRMIILFSILRCIIGEQQEPERVQQLKTVINRTYQINSNFDNNYSHDIGLTLQLIQLQQTTRVCYFVCIYNTLIFISKNYKVLQFQQSKVQLSLSNYKARQLTKTAYFQGQLALWTPIQSGKFYNKNANLTYQIALNFQSTFFAFIYPFSYSEVPQFLFCQFFTHPCMNKIQIFCHSQLHQLALLQCCIHLKGSSYKQVLQLVSQQLQSNQLLQISVGLI